MSVIANIKSEDIATIGTVMAPVFALLTLCVTTFGAVALAWIGYKQSVIAGMLKENTDITKDNAAVTKIVHDQTNDKMDKLLNTVAEASEIKGRLSAIEEARKDPNR